MSVLTLVLFLLLPIGEELHYTVRFGPFRVGTLDLAIQDVTTISQDSCYHFVARLKSNPGWRLLFEINDQLESYARIRDFATLRSSKRVSESGYQNQSQADFNYQSMKIYYSDSTIFDLKPETKDLLSVWYYFRSLSLNLKDTISVQVHVDKKNYDVENIVTGPEMIKTGIGELECIVIRPKTRNKQDIGTVYLSNDSKSIPAMIKKRFSFGFIIAILEKIGG
jgi:hypothetical protein